MTMVNWLLAAISVLLPYGLMIYVIDYVVGMVTNAFTRGRL